MLSLDVIELNGAAPPDILVKLSVFKCLTGVIY